ncbi:U3 small nucleolar RNA-associated protein NOL7 [Sminthopsis crassicaudata]|uniref:U3 small nucleolar RNA-associated protein NOL7 n=1 Tax=Sminthopsis crassicaudata TaxID=9301 RepID=UPI003D680D89
MVNLRPRGPRRVLPIGPVVDQEDEREESDSEEEEADLEFPDGGPTMETVEEEEEEDEDENEAPEELTFASAQAEAKKDERRLRDALLRDKQLLKEKRKRREELFAEQKKRKLLPATLLEELTAAPQTIIKESLPRLGKGNTESENQEKKEEKMFRTRVKKRYVACRLKDQDLIDLRQQAAKGFIQKYLYGRGSNRTTVNQFLSLDNKRLPVKKPAVQFVNNNWGAERKQSAKKFKKQWMHKKKLASRRPNIT